MIVSAEELEAIRRQAVEEYPRESCGVILQQGELRRIVRCRNVQDELHAKDPQRHTLDASKAYYMDPQDVLRINRLEREGFAIAVIYHSHVDVGAYFSGTDKKQAMMGDEPMYPGATYIVTSVVGRRVKAFAAFRWSVADRDFMQIDLAVPRWGWHERLVYSAGRLWHLVEASALFGRRS